MTKGGGGIMCWRSTEMIKFEVYTVIAITISCLCIQVAAGRRHQGRGGEGIRKEGSVVESGFPLTGICSVSPIVSGPQWVLSDHQNTLGGGCGNQCALGDSPCPTLMAVEWWGRGRLLGHSWFSLPEGGDFNQN